MAALITSVQRHVLERSDPTQMCRLVEVCIAGNARNCVDITDVLVCRHGSARHTSSNQPSHQR